MELPAGILNQETPQQTPTDEEPWPPEKISELLQTHTSRFSVASDKAKNRHLLSIVRNISTVASRGEKLTVERCLVAALSSSTATDDEEAQAPGPSNLSHATAGAGDLEACQWPRCGHPVKDNNGEYCAEHSELQAKWQHRHFSDRKGWIRAAVLGAQDGLASTTSLLIGLVAAGASTGTLCVGGSAALVSGALSMAVGEYVSVAAQADTEKADIARERELHSSPSFAFFELRELAKIYQERGLSPDLAAIVALQLSSPGVEKKILSHVRDDIGIDVSVPPRPFQASAVSGCTFSLGAIMPLLAACLASDTVVRLVLLCILGSVVLVGFGVIAALLGGASPVKSAVRLLLGGLATMGGTYLLGYVVGLLTGVDSLGV